MKVILNAPYFTLKVLIGLNIVLNIHVGKDFYFLHHYVGKNLFNSIANSRPRPAHMFVLLFVRFLLCIVVQASLDN